MHYPALPCITLHYPELLFKFHNIFINFVRGLLTDSFRYVFLMYSSFSSILCFFLLLSISNQAIIHFIDKNQYSLQKISENRVIKVQNAREIRKKIWVAKNANFLIFELNFFFELMEKRPRAEPSWAEPSWKSFSSSYGSSQLGSGSSLLAVHRNSLFIIQISLAAPSSIHHRCIFIF